MDLRALQQIRIVEHDRIRPFEWDDVSRPELPDSPGDLLRDPLLVTPLDDDFLLLDDSRLYYSLIDSGLMHLPVQICPTVQFTLTAEPLGLIRFGMEDLSRAVSRFPDRIEMTSPSDRILPSPDHLDLTFHFTDSSPVLVRIRHSTRSGCPMPLDAIFRAVLDIGSYFPLPESGGEAAPDSPLATTGSAGPAASLAKDDGTAADSTLEKHEGTASAYRSAFEHLPHHVPFLSGVVSLPSFELADLRLAVTTERLFPPGIIPVQTSCRVLNIDFPLNVLADQSTGIDDKQAFLTELIALRARKRRISCFDGRIYMLNR